jgi:hypothetical protein
MKIREIIENSEQPYWAKKLTQNEAQDLIRQRARDLAPAENISDVASLTSLAIKIWNAKEMGPDVRFRPGHHDTTVEWALNNAVGIMKSSGDNQSKSRTAPEKDKQYRTDAAGRTLRADRYYTDKEPSAAMAAISRTPWARLAGDAIKAAKQDPFSAVVSGFKLGSQIKAT